MRPTLALSIKQPWCGYLAAADARLGAPHWKRVEQRRWRPDSAVGQWIALHASNAPDGEGDDLLRSLDVDLPESRYQNLFTLGAVVAVGRIVHVQRVFNCREHAHLVFSAGLPEETADRAARHVASGSWGWHFADVRALTWPILCRGNRGLWVPPAWVSRAVEADLLEQDRRCA
ncbi:MAG: hypothetical protein M5U09_13655 [Gammaproteobacteria bacterium]|nr:hypothetical protein [Gammaproteobacteria bacterium]